MDKEILEVLKQIQATQQEHTLELKAINSKLGATYDELARTREDVTEIKESMKELSNKQDMLEDVTANNWVELVKIKKRQA